MQITCSNKKCDATFDWIEQFCPDCDHNNKIPYLRIIGSKEFTQPLADRFKKVQTKAQTDGWISNLQKLESQANNLKPIINLSTPMLLAHLKGVTPYLSNILKLRSQGDKDETEPEFSSMRLMVDGYIFFSESISKKVIFAILTPSDEGLFNYGEAHVILKSKQVKTCSTILEENSFVFF